jgi:hypothetical protein
MHLPVEQHGPNTPSFACGVTMQARPARALQPKELGATRQPKRPRARLQVRRRQRQLSVTLLQFPGRKNSEQAYSSRIAPVLARCPSRPPGRPRVSTEHQEKIMSKSQTRGHTFPLTQRISPFPSPGNATQNQTYSPPPRPRIRSPLMRHQLGWRQQPRRNFLKPTAVIALANPSRPSRRCFCAEEEEMP